MNASAIMRDAVPAEIRAEARRVADKIGAAYEDLPRITEALCHRAFMRDTEHLRAMKVEVCSLTEAMRPIMVRDGRIERGDIDLSPEERKAVEAIDQMIANVARRYGFELPDGAAIRAEVG